MGPLRRVNDLRGTLRRRAFAKESLFAFAFALALTVFEYLALNITLQPYLLLWQQHRYFVTVGSLLVILVCWFWFVIFVRVSLTANNITRVLCLVLFVFAEFLEYGYQKAFGQFATVEDLRIALFDANNEQRWNSIQAYVSWRAIVPSLAFAITLWVLPKRSERSWKPVALSLLGFFLFFSALSPFSAGQFPTVSFNAFLRTLSLAPWKWASTYHGPREAVATQQSTVPQNNVILVIDESVRGDHLAINNYGRDTTPILSEFAKQGWLYNWGVAASGSTCSEKSDSLLLTGMRIEELPDLTFQIRKRATIFQYAKAMGYRTHFFDAQKENYWLGTSYDQSYIDDGEFVSDFSTGSEIDRDAAVARKINQLVNSSTGHFIWVIKRGIHFPYGTNFPATTNPIWQPGYGDQSEIDPAKKQELINTYDNALRYNSDQFFGNLGVSGWRTKTMLVYTSDHGQTLSEHGEAYTHCGSSSATSPNEASVPLLLISKDGLGIDTRFSASHANVFATLLDLMGFPDSARLHQYDSSLLRTTAPDSRARYFWVGDFHERSVIGRLPYDR